MNPPEISAGTGLPGLPQVGFESARARSARSSVEIGQPSSQLLQYASISAPFLMSKISSPREYPGCTRSCPHFGHSEEKRHGSLIS